MCGIVGAVANHLVGELLIDGLKRLEYRGYDSAGLALVDANLQLYSLRVVGKVRQLQAAFKESGIDGCTGIAHTRWATHGAPTIENAHPFTSHAEFALVHNGIIENYIPLREKLKRAGYIFASQTDTETSVHLIHSYFVQTKDLLKAMLETAQELQGAYAIAVITKHDPDRLFAIRQGCPLVIGIGRGENFLASDPLALLVHTQEFIYLEDGDVADISKDEIRIYNSGKLVSREIHAFTLPVQSDMLERGKYRHYMQKEIMEQPQAIAACLLGRIAKDKLVDNIFGKETNALLQKVAHIHIVACGTSYHAAMVARYWIEDIAKLPCTAEIASEYRYREIALSPQGLFICISQSGETADTLAALRLAKKMNYLATLAICNVAESSIVREADLNFLTSAGIEIGVASTKAFTTQLVSLLLFTLSLSKFKKLLINDEAKWIKQLNQLPSQVQAVLDQDTKIQEWARIFTDKTNAIFLGRGSLYPIALEGALKMKEISYIHAEGYPAGELKHGPLALIDDEIPVVALVSNDKLREKNLSNLQEVAARGGNLYILTDQESLLDQNALRHHAHIILIPHVSTWLNPIIYTVPLQMLAYHVAILKGTDVDQPRNLAKSVTVE